MKLKVKRHMKLKVKRSNVEFCLKFIIRHNQTALLKQNYKYKINTFSMFGCKNVTRVWCSLAANKWSMTSCTIQAGKTLNWQRCLYNL